MKPQIKPLSRLREKQNTFFRLISLDEGLLATLFVFFFILTTGLLLRILQPLPLQEIAGFTTSLVGRTRGQLHNIRLATEKLDGEIIPPSGIFSFNQKIGPFSPDRGYVKGWAILDGELIPQYGGGVCQVSSTLYNCALLANFKIVERTRHLWPVRSVPPGLDAAVASGSFDLKFQNTLSIPVRIQAQIVGQRLSIRFLSSSLHPYQVKIVREVLATFPPAEIYQLTSDLPQGTYQRVNKGQYGCRVLVYRVLYRDQKEIKRESISQDYYAPVNRVIRGGRE